MYRELIRRIENYSREQGILEKNTGIVVGLSGGGDSVFLLKVLKELQKKWCLRVCAVHVNHGIRGEEALRDEQFSRQLAEEMGIHFECFREDIPALAKKLHMGQEEAGRQFRYQCFEEMRERLGYDYIAVAHHREDQAETILFHMLRGSGLRGMEGMRSLRGRVMRPLLCVGKEEILRALEEEHVKFCVDSTNEETHYRRNMIRKEIFPLLQQVHEGAVSHLVRLGEELGRVMAYLDSQTEECYQEIVKREENGLRVREDSFLALPAVLQRELILRMLEEMAGQRRDIGAVHVTQLQKLFAGDTGREIHLPYGLRGWKEYPYACLGRKAEGEMPDEENLSETFFPGEDMTLANSLGERWLLRGEVKPREALREINLKKYCTKCFDYDKMDTMPRFRYWETGDYLWLDREGHTKKLSRIFVDEKIPKHRRHRMPVLALGSHVLWIPELNRQSAYFYVTEETQKVLLIHRMIEDVS